ncbi:hypothetical protein CXF72_13210 [Psychromonas sp. MB-3u-54]|uniref:DUF2914 domain-containing protein n=1 Tax=Psychromonas sp. MB-3u-54 TaxID=2058319 RepID=UPI000C348335|nr:DUF2914 domain-containing protein [Psychromonas sp. MB-3u-54]PKH02157.1 hypothetical protein CXF72_13210 [Psychromonas sp. MB-3u-54]
MNEPKKLTIRINFRPEKDRAPEKKKRWTYHWGRIIGISLTAIIAIALLISGGSYYLNQDQINSESVADKSLSSSLKKEAVRAASQKEFQLTATAAEKSSLKIESGKTPSVASNEPIIKAVEISASAIGNKKMTITAEEFAVINPAAVEAKTVTDEVAVIRPTAADKTEEIIVIKHAAADTKTASKEFTDIKSTTADTSEEIIVIRPAATDTADTTDEIVVIKPAAADTKTASKEFTDIKSATADISEDATVIKPAAVDTTEDATVIKPAAVDTTEDVTIIKPAAYDTTEDITTIEPTTADEVDVIKPAAAEKKFVSERLFTQSRKKLLSDNVTRFIISQAVEGNEPIGTLDNIHFDSNNIATVYAYSNVNGLKDQTVYYQWSLNGKNIAKIKVKVGANRWRSYSSKFIQPNMHGEWKVELQNQEGENLAINQFNY